MAPWRGRFRFPLYLRLWLAVVVAVIVLTLSFGWLWRATAQQQAPAREVIIRDETGQIVGRVTQRAAWVPGEGLEFQVGMNDGSTLFVQLPPRQRSVSEGPATPRPWTRTSDTLLWVLGITALAVAVGAYPVVRRLTQRLDDLRLGVERWGEGDLSVRVNERGSDELAFVAQRFNHAAERLETLLKSHKSLLANASHELRSPLARIRMGLELMEDASASVKEEIRRNIAELDQLIDEILLASRLDAKETDIGSFEAVDLTGLAAEECAHTGAELMPPADGQPVIVAGVVKLLRRAVRNLLENARRYSDGPVTLEIAREQGSVVLRVRDRGPGVPASERERIFEPFYRLPGASELHGGVGLGLALVRSIAQRHHGAVACENQEGGGACFSLRLPEHAAAPA
jgi:two-component system, OmpR family, sensor kinase